MDRLTMILLLGMSSVIPLYGLVLISSKAALALILTLALTPGLMELLLGIPSAVPRAIMELAIIMLFTKALYLQIVKRGQSFKAVGLVPMMILFAVSLISFLLSQQPYTNYLQFLRYSFIFYLFFLSLLNLTLSETTVKIINGYLILIFAFQIVPALIKFMQVGFQEGGGIGTVSVNAGEFSTTLPLFAISFLLSFYYWRRDVKYLLWIPVFVAFGIMGEKRALVFYIPILLFFVYGIFLYGRGKGEQLLVMRRRLKRIFIALILISFATLYVGFRLMEGLNPEQTAGGSFDIGFAFRTVYEYESNVLEEGGYFEKDQGEAYTGPALATGRISSTLMSFQRLVSEGPLTLLLGSGAGLLVAPPLAGREVFETFRSIGIRYGFTGLVWMVNQVGILGAALFLFFYLQLFKKGLAVHRRLQEPYWNSIALGFLGATFVFVLDFLTYSLSTLTMGSLTAVYYYVAAICFGRAYKASASAASSAARPAVVA